MAACCTGTFHEYREPGEVFSSMLEAVNLQGYFKRLQALKVRKCEHLHSLPTDAMIKPLRHFIAATPLGTLMSLTHQHP